MPTPMRMAPEKAMEMPTRRGMLDKYADDSLHRTIKQR